MDGNSGTGEADFHLLIQAPGLNPEQLRVGKILLSYPTSELDVHFLHILVYARSDHTWSCDKSRFTEGKIIRNLLSKHYQVLSNMKSDSYMLMTFPDLTEFVFRFLSLPQSSIPPAKFQDPIPKWAGVRIFQRKGVKSILTLAKQYT